MNRIVLTAIAVTIALLTTACSSLSLNKTKEGAFYSIRGRCTNGFTFIADKDGKNVSFTCQKKEKRLPSKPSKPN